MCLIQIKLYTNKLLKHHFLLLLALLPQTQINTAALAMIHNHDSEFSVQIKHSYYYQYYLRMTFKMTYSQWMLL